MTSTGNWAAYVPTRSTSPVRRSSSSSRRSAVAWIDGSNCAVARGVNARFTSRRKRVWSGGSTTSMDGGSATPDASRSSPKASAHRTQPGAAERSQPTPKLSERRTSRATACDVVARPRLLGTSGPRARSSS